MLTIIILVYQMDVERAFLDGTIGEEVYVKQPPCLENSKNPDKVYTLHGRKKFTSFTKHSMASSKLLKLGMIASSVF